MGNGPMLNVAGADAKWFEWLPNSDAPEPATRFFPRRRAIGPLTRRGDGQPVQPDISPVPKPL